LDTETKEGRFAKRMRECIIYPGNPYHPQTTPAQWAILEHDIRDVCFAFGLNYESYVLSLVVYADDDIGIDAENWRRGVQYYLHASPVPPRTVAQLRKLDAKYPMTASVAPQRRGLFGDLFGL
jgi:hypothetical protein